MRVSPHRHICAVRPNGASNRHEESVTMGAESAKSFDRSGEVDRRCENEPKGCRRTQHVLSKRSHHAVWSRPESDDADAACRMSSLGKCIRGGIEGESPKIKPIIKPTARLC